MTTKQWTLVVVCAATAMLMLDIAVVNTALSRIAEDLDAGLAGLQWAVDAYTLAIATTVLTVGSLADRFGRRRLFTSASPSSPSPRPPAPPRPTSPCSTAPAPCRASARRSCSPSRWPCWPTPSPAPRSARGALAAYGATIGGAFAIGPAVGGALTSGLDWQWIFLINVPLGIACLWITRAKVAGVPGPARSAGRLARPVDADRRPVPPRPRAAARQRGRLGQHVHRRRAGRRGRCCSPRSWPSSRARPRRCSRSSCSATRRSPARRSAAFAISASFFAVFLYTTLYLQQVLGLSAIEAGLVYLPGHDRDVRRRPARRPSWANGVSPGRWSAAAWRSSAVGMALHDRCADATSSWTIVLPGSIIAHDRHRPVQPVGHRRRAGLRARRSRAAWRPASNDTFRQGGIAVGVAALGALIPAQDALRRLGPTPTSAACRTPCGPAPRWRSRARSPRCGSSGCPRASRRWRSSRRTWCRRPPEFTGPWAFAPAGPAAARPASVAASSAPDGAPEQDGADRGDDRGDERHGERDDAHDGEHNADDRDHAGGAAHLHQPVGALLARAARHAARPPGSEIRHRGRDSSGHR